jgi:hypothetical protein
MLLEAEVVEVKEEAEEEKNKISDQLRIINILKHVTAEKN